MFIVYILHSESLNKFYTGQTIDLTNRLKEHNDINSNKNTFTKAGIPWIIFHTITCETRTQAIKIENHIKKMKSKSFIRNLKQYQELSTKIKQKFV